MCQVRRTIQNQLETVSVECKDMNVGCSLQLVSPNYSAALFVEFESALSAPYSYVLFNTFIHTLIF